VPCRLLIAYPFFRIHFRFSSDFSMGVKPYNSNDFSIRRSDELFSFSALRVLTGVATQGMLLNKRVRLHHVHYFPLMRAQCILR